MTTMSARSAGKLTTLILVLASCAPAHAKDDKFALARAIPNDVLMYASEQNNPQNAFIYDYWQEVFDAVKQAGVADDLLGMMTSLMGEHGAAEVERLKARATELLQGVNWGEMCAHETVFAERLPPPMRSGGRGVYMGPANMVWMFRGSGEGLTHNFEGLIAILQAMSDEINLAAGKHALSVQRTTKHGADVASVNLLESLPGAPDLPLAVARRDDLVLIALGEPLFHDVLKLLDGDKSLKSLADDPRFHSAFADLPPAKDSMVFFNMHALSKPMRHLTKLVGQAVGEPPDTYQNAGMNSDATPHHELALDAYRQGKHAEALEQTHKAYKCCPDSSIVTYNLACFSALSGQKDEALKWLDKAVDVGFWAPSKIASDSDLVSLRDDPRYKATLSKASKMAREADVDDVINNSPKKGEVATLCNEAWKVHKEKDYARCLQLVEQAYELTPTDSRVLYYLSCFHALLGHNDRALDFLDKAVDGGFYCPKHISKDPDLESIRNTERYTAAVARARAKAADASAGQSADKLKLVQTMLSRVMDSAEILDYAATVISTEGHSVHTQSMAMLAPDAKDRAIYPIFGNRKPLTSFENYLPKETVSFSVNNGIDFAALYGFLEDTLREAGPRGQDLLKKWQGMQEEAGWNFKNDVISWLDGQTVSATLEDNLGWVLFLKVDDEDAARKQMARAMDVLTAKMTEAVTEIPALAMAMIRRSPVVHDRLEGFENLHIGMSPQPVVWGVADGHLILAASPDAVTLCLDTAEGKHPNIRENKRVMSEVLLPEGPFACIKLSDRRNIGEEIAMILGVVSMAGGTAAMAIPDQDAKMMISRIAGMVAKLGPAASKIDFYKSTSAYSSFDGKAFHTHSVTHYFSPEEHAARRAPPVTTNPAPTNGL